MPAPPCDPKGASGANTELNLTGWQTEPSEDTWLPTKDRDLLHDQPHLRETGKEGARGRACTHEDLFSGNSKRAPALVQQQQDVSGAATAGPGWVIDAATPGSLRYGGSLRSHSRWCSSLQYCREPLARPSCCFWHETSFISAAATVAGTGHQDVGKGFSCDARALSVSAAEVL